MQKYLFILALGLVSAAQGAIINIDFEGLANGDVLSNQFPPLTFQGGTVATAGLDLNDAQFPPRSGDNVATDTGGPIAILFSVPVLQFSGYFTYNTEIRVYAYDSQDLLVGSATSVFFSNFVGTPNPSNEQLVVSFAGGISRVTLNGSVVGSTFVVDDLELTTAEESTIPEPATFGLVFAAIGAFCFRRK